MTYKIIHSENFSPTYGEGVFFDLDWTLIKPAGHYKFYNIRNDYAWVWNFGNVVDVLKILYQKGMSIYIVTNQLKYDDIVENRINQVMEKLGVECCFLISTAHDHFRKPGVSLLSLLEGKIIIGEKSFYCGDAAGRENDHSDDDLFFAFNTKIPFLYPEEVFNEKKFVGKLVKASYDFMVDTEIEKKLKEIYLNYDGVFLVGLPGTGKTFIREWFIETFGEKDIDYLNNDEKKTKWDEKKRFLIIDNTNTKEKNRQNQWKGKNLATIYLDFPLKESFRGIKYRCSLEQKSGSHISDMVVRMLYKNLEPPKNPTLHLKKRPILSKSFPLYLHNNI